MRKISKKLSSVYLWFSLHDTTPSVIAEKRAVYCHNPFPFYKWNVRELFFTPKIVLFSLFSNCIYQKNIHKNAFVVVQQQWIRSEFIRLFNLNEQSIVVATPQPQENNELIVPKEGGEEEYSFLFPASPNSHKNFECICRAADILVNKFGVNNFKVYITVRGDENEYAKWLYRNWGGNSSAVKFIGFLDRISLYQHYQKCNCLIFPSKVETWGLPITEFASFRKPMLLADLPYAYETANGMEHVAFFNANSPQELAGKMKSLVGGNKTFLIAADKKSIPSPVACTWQELFNILLK